MKNLTLIPIARLELSVSIKLNNANSLLLAPCCVAHAASVLDTVTPSPFGRLCSTESESQKEVKRA